MNRFYFYFPPLRKVSGGMQVIADLALHLFNDGQKSFLVLQNVHQGIKDWLNGYYPDLPLVRWDDFAPDSGDWWIVPEGWPLALRPGLAAKCRCVVYVQNWAFVHGHLPSGVFWGDLPVVFWAVSSPVADFIRSTIGLTAPIVPPAIDVSQFHASDSERSATIAWMPRKNRGLALQARNILEAIRRKNGASFPEWVEIDGKSREEVSDIMRSCGIFFASGFPEGCPLPPLEAMACGCVVAGFGGLGGWDYMRQGLPLGYMPALDLLPRSWGPNGFYAADADVFGAAIALDHALNILNTPEGVIILRNAQCTVRHYSRQNQKTALFKAIESMHGK